MCSGNLTHALQQEETEMYLNDSCHSIGHVLHVGMNERVNKWIEAIVQMTWVENSYTQNHEYP